jgi:hypothetical protein
VRRHTGHRRYVSPAQSRKIWHLKAADRLCRAAERVGPEISFAVKVRIGHLPCATAVEDDQEKASFIVCGMQHCAIMVPRRYIQNRYGCTRRSMTSNG